MPGPMIIKFGGSLLERDCGATLRSLGRVFDQSTGPQRQILILPGGGPFADTVRHHGDLLRLPQEACHFMALSAMSQYAYLLREYIPGSRISELGRDDLVRIPGVQILLCEAYFREVPEQELPRSWEVTSDSIAAYLARQLEASMLVLLKSTDVAPHLGPPGVDEYFHRLLPLPCPAWVVNGAHPERLRQLLVSGYTQGLFLPPGRTAAVQNP